MTLTACGASAARIDLAPVAPDPVVEVRREIVTLCPAELRTPSPVRPQPAADALIEFNTPGAEWIARMVAWAEAAIQTLDDARAQCPATP